MAYIIPMNPPIIFSLIVLKLRKKVISDTQVITTSGVKHHQMFC